LARIALDAMGGDHAPAETVAGAVEAAAGGVEVVLVGRAAELEAELAEHDVTLPIVDASDVIGMGDDPARALREKPEASIVVAAGLVARGEASGFVSAGSTGAAMAAAAIVVGRVPGVSRPPIASVIPTPGSPTVILDVGANPDVKPAQLLQFAVMGSLMSKLLLEIDSPRVGLLSNGEEKGKGRDLEKAAYDLLEASSLEFIGNVESRDIAVDNADVIVTDGFTGNILLKAMEGMADLIALYMGEEIRRLDPETQEAVAPLLQRVGDRLDYETYGGAHLLGVKGTVVICHGSSTRTSIRNALTLAAEGAEKDLPGEMAVRIAEL
jgi:glycerol-3-phosphate acyltransferase PlsX